MNIYRRADDRRAWTENRTSVPHQLPSNEIERLLSSPLPRAGAVTAKGAVERVNFLGIGHSEVNEAHGLGFGTASGSGDARDFDTEVGPRAFLDAFGKGGGDFGRWSARFDLYQPVSTGRSC